MITTLFAMITDLFAMLSVLFAMPKCPIYNDKCLAAGGIKPYPVILAAPAGRAQRRSGMNYSPRVICDGME